METGATPVLRAAHSLFLRRKWSVFFRRVTGAIINIFSTLEKRRGHRPRFAVGTVDRGTAVLRQIYATHPVRLVRPAAMKQITVERHDAAGGNNQRIARITAGIADEVVRPFFLVMVNDFAARAAARMRQN